MFNLDFTFLWTAVNLALMYWAVNKFLFKRLGAKMEQRSVGIAAGLEQAETLKAESERLRQEQDGLRREAAAQRQALLDETKEHARQEYARIVEEAKREAVRVRDEARSDIEREQAQSRQTLLDEVVSLAVDAATGVMEANMDSPRNREMVERFLTKAG